MFFVEFYADWLALCNIVPLKLVRAKNYGTNTRIDIRHLNLNFYK